MSRLAAGETLSSGEAEDVFGVILDGHAGSVALAGLLMALRVRGETEAELAGAVAALRARMVRVEAPAGAVDVCGTGGDAAGTLNISTAVALVVAGCGVVVAKHGNRALSSRSGGADVLAALGVGLVGAERAAGVLARAGVAFLFAPAHHAGMAHAAEARRALGTRTIFNLLGPLANPAGVRRQLVGVFAPRWLRPVAEVLGRLGAERAWVVHGQGLDELTLAGPTEVVEWRDGGCRAFVVRPEDAGLAPAPLAAIAGGDAAENAAALLGVLGGAAGAYRDTVLLNAAAALVVAGRVEALREGVGVAARAIDGGGAGEALRALRRETA
ncbi:MAG: anthranilate phosphoribosyltransferase [Janthinobacterium lividum]